MSHLDITWFACSPSSNYAGGNASKWTVDTLLTSLISSCISVMYSGSTLDSLLSSLSSIALAYISLSLLENEWCNLNMMMSKLFMCRESEKGMLLAFFFLSSLQ